MADFCLAERFLCCIAFTSEQKWMNVQCVASWIWFTKWDCCYSCISKWIAAGTEIHLMINSLHSLFVSRKYVQRGDCLYFLSDSNPDEMSSMIVQNRLRSHLSLLTMYFCLLLHDIAHWGTKHVAGSKKFILSVVNYVVNQFRARKICQHNVNLLHCVWLSPMMAAPSLGYAENQPISKNNEADLKFGSLF